MKDPSLTKFGGRVSDSGEGRWTIKAAIDEAVPTPVLTTALYERFSSRGDADFADKLCLPCASSSAGIWRSRRSSFHRDRKNYREIRMTFEVLADAAVRCRKGRRHHRSRRSSGGRGSREVFMAVSGGHTPWVMLRALANEDVPWAGVHIFQVDERVAPDGDPDRNLTHLHESLLEQCPFPASRSMPCRWKCQISKLQRSTHESWENFRDSASARFGSPRSGP